MLVLASFSSGATKLVLDKDILKERAASPLVLKAQMFRFKSQKDQERNALSILMPFTMVKDTNANFHT